MQMRDAPFHIGMFMLRVFNLERTFLDPIICYWLEARSTWFILAFAGSCPLGSAYGFLPDAWPFGSVEAVWSAVAARRWWVERKRSAR
jgi:hypothetical protein